MLINVKIGFVTIQNNIVLKLVSIAYCITVRFVTIQNNIVLKRAFSPQLWELSFVTIQNNIVLKQCTRRYCKHFSFVTIQNNIVLKLPWGLVCTAFRFVTIQNNIVLKPQSLKKCHFKCNYHSYSSKSLSIYIICSYERGCSHSPCSNVNTFTSLYTAYLYISTSSSFSK